MEENNKQQKIEPTANSKNIFKIVLIYFLITIVGIGVIYLWQNSEVKKLRTANKTLEEQKSFLMEKATNITAANKILLSMANETLNEQNATVSEKESSEAGREDEGVGDKLAKTQEEISLVKKGEESVILAMSDYPVIQYPLDHSATPDSPAQYILERKSEIEKNIINPFQSILKDWGYEVVKIEIWSRQKDEFRMDTIVFDIKSHVFYRYTVTLPIENDLIPLLKGEDMEPGPGYRG